MSSSRYEQYGTYETYGPTGGAEAATVTGVTGVTGAAADPPGPPGPPGASDRPGAAGTARAGHGAYRDRPHEPCAGPLTDPYRPGTAARAAVPGAPDAPRPIGVRTYWLLDPESG
ncbi:hypothetical protein ABZ871_35205, partial [Streptomyces populi]